MPQCGQSSAVGRYRAVTGGFGRPLPMLGAICRCLSRSQVRSWPRSHGHLANVGLTLGRLQVTPLTVHIPAVVVAAATGHVGSVLSPELANPARASCAAGSAADE